MVLQTLLQELDQADLWEGKQELKRNDYLKTGGTVDSNVYFVEEGCLHIFIDDGKEEHTIRFGYAGDLVAAMDSFITDEPSDFYMQALRKTVVKYMKGEALRGFLLENEERMQLWTALMEQLILQMMERERDLLIQSPAERYQRVLKRSPQLFQEVPSKYIASYLRMSPETLSRLKNID